MADAVAEGVRGAGAQVDVRRVLELVPEEVARRSGDRLDQPAPIARVDDPPGYDAIIVGDGTRFGRKASQMANFLDHRGALWARGALTGKVGSAFTCTTTQHGHAVRRAGNHAMAIHTNLLHFGMVLVGLPCSFEGRMRLDDVVGGAPDGATAAAAIAGGDGARQPSPTELDGARFRGRRLAELAARPVARGAPSRFRVPAQG